MNKMPVLFVGHGSPMNALDAENPFNQGFRRIVQKFAKPKAILMISAHWYGKQAQADREYKEQRKKQKRQTKADNAVSEE